MLLDQFPPINEQLLRALDQTFPEKTPTLDEPIDRIRERGGERRVVLHLLAVYRAQQGLTNPEGTDVQSQEA